MASSCNWSELLDEMLENIAHKCLSMDLKDFVMFSCVCSSWYRAATVAKSTVFSQPQMPWFLLPNDDGEDEPKDDRRNMFDLSNNKSYNISLPQAFKRRCYGTGTEWTLTIGLDRQIQLFNFQTQALLSLPSYHTFADPPELDDEEPTEEQKAAAEEWYRKHNIAPKVEPFNNDEWFRFYYVERAFVVYLDQDQDQDQAQLIDPPLQEQEEDPLSSKLLVVVIYGNNRNVAVAKPKDTKWTPIIVDDVCDAVYCPTSRLMLFLQRRSGKVSCCDLQQLFRSTTTAVPLSLTDFAPPPSFILQEDRSYSINYEKLYLLLESSSGDILMIRRSYDDAYPVDEEDEEKENEDEDIHEEEKMVLTFEFDVYKLDLQIKEWKELQELGDLALFLGNSSATCVKASNFPTTCKPNSIYFNDDGLSLYAWPAWGPRFDERGNAVDFALGGRDMGVYNVADGTIHPFYPGDNYFSKYSVAIWLKPKL